LVWIAKIIKFGISPIAGRFNKTNTNPIAVLMINHEKVSKQIQDRIIKVAELGLQQERIIFCYDLHLPA